MEVAIDNIESAINAFNGGCIRIELCSSLNEGGLTPSVGFLRKCKKLLNIPIFVMIRCRGGDFVYSDHEIEIMADDLKILKENGADGFVFGILNNDKTVNFEKCLKLIQLAEPKPCTFHRAFDEIENYENSLEICIKLGFKRILTSGLKSNALDGIKIIKSLINQANGRIIIMPGAGININNINEILEKSKAKEFHGSAKENLLIHGHGRNITNEKFVAHMVEVYKKIVL
ncbi:hypothetical protein O3M35_004163 [Rhynocoris fuscipes]|uniref:Copper homeostasis protein cutC homolog n=1 Tax=Rhynocoris fuscipes TaxID=488301 RepID=A0AAW1CMI2_9HEMI